MAKAGVEGEGTVFQVSGMSQRRGAAIRDRRFRLATSEQREIAAFRQGIRLLRPPADLLSLSAIRPFRRAKPFDARVDENRGEQPRAGTDAATVEQTEQPVMPLQFQTGRQEWRRTLAQARQAATQPTRGGEPYARVGLKGKEQRTA